MKVVSAKEWAEKTLYEKVAIEARETAKFMRFAKANGLHFVANNRAQNNLESGFPVVFMKPELTTEEEKYFWNKYCAGLVLSMEDAEILLDPDKHAFPLFPGDLLNNPETSRSLCSYIREIQYQRGSFISKAALKKASQKKKTEIMNSLYTSFFKAILYKVKVFFMSTSAKRISMNQSEA